MMKCRAGMAGVMAREPAASIPGSNNLHRLARLSLLVLVSACGDGGHQQPDPPKSPAFLAAEARCGQQGREPAVEWLPTITCDLPYYSCCIKPDRGSEYDPGTNTVRVAGTPECRDFATTVSLPCEYENSVSFQNGGTVDRCFEPCGR